MRTRLIDLFLLQAFIRKLPKNLRPSDLRLPRNCQIVKAHLDLAHFMRTARSIAYSIQRWMILWDSQAPHVRTTQLRRDAFQPFQTKVAKMKVPQRSKKILTKIESSGRKDIAADSGSQERLLGHTGNQVLQVVHQLLQQLPPVIDLVDTSTNANAGAVQHFSGDASSGERSRLVRFSPDQHIGHPLTLHTLRLEVEQLNLLLNVIRSTMNALLSVGGGVYNGVNQSTWLLNMTARETRSLRSALLRGDVPMLWRRYMPNVSAMSIGPPTATKSVNMLCQVDEAHTVLRLAPFMAHLQRRREYLRSIFQPEAAETGGIAAAWLWRVKVEMQLLFFPQRLLAAASLFMGNLNSAGARRLSFQVVLPSHTTSADANHATMFGIKGLYLRGCALQKDTHHLDKADATTLALNQISELIVTPKRPSFDKAHPNRHQVPLYTMDGHEPVAWVS